MYAAILSWIQRSAAQSKRHNDRPSRRKEERSERTRRTGVSYGASILLHVVGMLILAMILTVLPSATDANAVDTVLHQVPANGAEQFTVAPLEVAPQSEAVPLDVLDALADGIGLDANTHRSRIGAGPIALDVALAGTGFGLRAPDFVESDSEVNLADEVVAGETSTVKSGKGTKNAAFASIGSGKTQGSAGKGGGKKPYQSNTKRPKVKFFGEMEEANSVVFVVDRSGSLAEMGGLPFQRLIQELRNSVAQLNSDQKFCIVFFTTAAIPQYYPDRTDAELYAATPAEIQKARRWLDQARPDGFTDPTNALMMALKLEPEVVFLLTDGLFPDYVPRVIRNTKPEKTIVHTIGFVHRTGEAILQEIAEENQGRYTFVP
jgi:hypothetical protein